MLIEDLLERDLAVQLFIEGHENGAQTALRMRPEHSIALRRMRRRAGGKGYGCLDARREIGGDTACERSIQLRIADRSQPGMGRRPHANGSETLLHISAVTSNVARDQGFYEPAVRGLEVMPSREMFRQRLRLIAAPRLERREELVLIDDPVLERENSEQQVAFGVSSHGVISGPRQVLADSVPKLLAVTGATRSGNDYRRDRWPMHELEGGAARVAMDSESR
jgi:hypothetical protein